MLRRRLALILALLLMFPSFALSEGTEAVVSEDVSDIEETNTASDVSSETVTEAIPTPTAEPTPAPTLEAESTPTAVATAEPTVEATIEAEPTATAEVIAVVEGEPDESALQDAAVESILQELSAKKLSKDYDRAEWLYSYLIDNTTPDATLDTAAAVILQGKGNSLGYARAMKLLLGAADIDCKLVTSDADSDIAWVVAELDDTWMHIDAYADDAAGTNGKHFALYDSAMQTDHSWDRDSVPACVDPDIIAPTQIVPASAALTLGVGQSASVAGWSFLPDGSSSEDAVTYSSSNAKVVQVDTDGTVKAVRTGSATIGISVGTLSATVNVNVLAAPKSIKLSVDKTMLGVGETAQLSVKPSKKSAASYSFVSSNTDVIAIDGTRVRALCAGKAKITATSHNKKKSSVTITVKDEPTELTLSDTKLTLGVGETYTLVPTLSAGSAGAIDFVAENDRLTVDATGKITALSEGECVITVSTYNDIERQCSVRITAEPKEVTLATANGRTSYGIGEKAQLSWKVDGRDSTDVKFSSSNKKYATVSASGVVTFKRKGNVTITVKTYNGVSARISLKCKYAPSSVSLRLERTTLGVSETLDMTAKLSSGSAGSCSFTSDNPDVVSVDGSKLTAVAPGKAKITVKTYNKKKATKTVTVCPAPDSMTLDSAELTLGTGETYTLVPALNAGSAGAIRFESSDPAVVSVDSADGSLCALAYGSARVTATSYNGVSVSCDVTVKNAPEGISIEGIKPMIACGDTYQLPSPTLQGEDVSSNKIKYKSSDTDIASVSAAGLLKARRAGKCKITVSTYNGKKTTVSVKVVSAPKSISISPKAVSLCMNQELRPTIKFNTGASGNYTLKSSDESIAVITEDGLGIRIVGSGTVKITATSYNKKTAVMTITALALPTEIALSPAQSTVGLGETVQLRAVMPDGQGSLLSYESDNPDVVSVDENGLVQTHATGNATITVHTQNGLSATSSLTVLSAPTWLRVAPEKAAYALSEKGFTLRVLFQSAQHGGSVRFESDDTSIATVSDAGEVRFVKTGTVNITATSYNGHKATCALTIGQKPQEMHFAQESYTVAVGDCVSVPAEFEQGAESYTLTVADAKYALVSDNMVTGLTEGETTITVTSASGLSAQCKLIVVAPPEGLELEQEQITLTLGKDQTVLIGARPMPQDAGTLRYSSSDPTVASVDVLSGALTPLKLGDCVVTVSTYDGRFSKTCSVHVSGLLEGVKIGIDPGHQRYHNDEQERSAPKGGTNKDKVAGCPRGTVTNIPEYVTNLTIGLQLRDALEKLGAEVKMTRTSHDVNISNKERALMMNDFGADLVLRLHCNGWKSGGPNGISLHVSKSWGPTKEAKRAAKLLMASMLKETGANSRGISVNDNFTGNNWSTVPCILVEMGFITNAREDKLLNKSPAYQQKVVRGMINGICDFMGRDRPVVW